MKNVLSIFALLAWFSVAQGFVTPLPPKTTTTTALQFQPSNTPGVEEEASQKPYKVTTLSSVETPHDGPRRSTLLGKVGGKAVEFLLFTYEIDRKEFGNLSP
jgi:hypothetical protein